MQKIPAFSMNDCVITVPDICSSAHFYMRVFGLELYRSETKADRTLQTVYLRHHESTLCLCTVETRYRESSVKNDDRPGSTDAETQCLAIRTGSLGHFYEYMSTITGIDISPIHYEKFGSGYFSFRDPDGNLVRVETRPEDFPFVRAIQHSYI